ncbi:MAG: MASE1 domain-containing protein [Thermoflexales bacterium]|nr:MASE1 domain-containing protein [Thermoflexales bacterium]
MNHGDEFFPRWDVLRLVLIALAYFLAHQVAFLFPYAERVLPAVWPASGIGLAALLLSPRRLWPAIAGALFAAGYSADLLAGRSALASLGFMTANVTESLVSAWLISSTCGYGVRFDRVKQVAALLVAAVHVNAVTASIGAGAAVLVSHTSFWSFWLTWWTTSGLGIVLVTPLIVSWAGVRDLSGLRWKRALEAGAFMLVWCALAWSSFNAVAVFLPFTSRPYLLMALLAWPALRYGQRGAALALAVLAGVAVTGTAINAGPSPLGGDSPLERLLLAQAFLGITALSGLLLAASYAETQAAGQAMREDQARLRASEAAFRELADSIADVFFAMDEDLRYTYWNRASEVLTGISAQDALGKSIFELFPDTLGTRSAAELYRDVLAAQRPRIFVNENILGGTHYFFEISAYPSRRGLSVFARDITERIRTEAVRRQAEETLRQLETRHQAILMEAPDIIMEVDVNKVYTWANPAGYEFFGDDVIGKEASYYFLGEQETYVQVQPLLNGSPDMLYVESWQRRQDGQKRLLAWWCKSLHDSEGRVSGVLSTARDITEQKQAEGQIRQQMDELQRWHNVTLGREDRVRELKLEVNQLLARLGEPPRYGRQDE